MSRIRNIFNKFASGTCSREEFDELMLLLQKEDSDPEIRQALKDIYDSLDTEILSDMQIDKRGSIIELEKAIGFRARKKSLLRRKIAIAACLLVFVGLGTYIFSINWLWNKQDQSKITQISTQEESKTNLILPDGSKVWLNSYSTIIYNAGFDNGKREVTLIGEALFDVKHDSINPFVVHTKNFDVTDMGTVFNVSSYPEDPTAVASLISGSIEVSLKERQKEKIVLVPNQRITVQNDTKATSNTENKELLVKTSIIPDPQTQIMPDTAWMARMLMFRDVTFYELALQMQRRYGVKVTFNEAAIGEYKFTGKFEDETLEEALLELQAIAPFTFRRQKDNIYINR